MWEHVCEAAVILQTVIIYCMSYNDWQVVKMNNAPHDPCSYLKL